MADSSPIIVLVTASSEGEAQRVANGLLEARLAACVSMVPGIYSRYFWAGKLEESEEVMLIVKSRQGLLEKIIACVKDRHSYDVPEILALPVISGNPDYLKWLDEETGGSVRTP